MLIAVGAAALLAACDGVARLPVSAGVGPEPRLPPPDGGPLPSLFLAPVTGWPAGRAPLPADGLAVTAFARGLQHPRWLYVLPGGDVLVAETGAPPRPGYSRGIKGWFMRRLM
jgi:glucose/arabinose dehydrogenase